MIIIHGMNNRTYRPRALTPLVERTLKSHPVVVVSGARQTGKTTLVRHLLKAGDRTFETLDDLDVLELAQKRPDDLLARGKRLTLDEVQRVPELLLAIKRAVDRQRRNGKFLLTGSANLLLMKSVSDSLSGRAVYLTLPPFTNGEKRGDGRVPPWQRLLSCNSASAAVEFSRSVTNRATDWRKNILVGGMPPAVLAKTGVQRSAWFEGYIRTYLERDLRDITQVSSLPDFRRLMELTVHRLGRLTNQTELARDSGLSQATVNRHLNLLETTFQIHRLPVFSANPSKRLIKSPMLYWTDAGLAAHMSGLTNLSDLARSGNVGRLLENLVFTGLIAWRETVQRRPGIFYWRTAGGAEVDFVIEMGNRILPIEIKTSGTVSLSDIRHLEVFLKDYTDRATWAAVLHDADAPHMITKKVAGLPISQFV